MPSNNIKRSMALLAAIERPCHLVGDCFSFRKLYGLSECRPTFPRQTVNVERGNWKFKITRQGHPIRTYRTKLWKLVVTAEYFLDV